MKVTLTFEKKDFATLRKFGEAVEKQCGKTYVGSDSLCWYFDYPPSLSALLRPSQVGSELRSKMMAELEKGSVTFEIESSREESKL